MSMRDAVVLICGVLMPFLLGCGSMFAVEYLRLISNTVPFSFTRLIIGGLIGANIGVIGGAFFIRMIERLAKP